MASCDQYRNRLNQVRRDSYSSLGDTRHHGFSKAQACLNKILHTISFSKTCESSKEPSLSPPIDGFGDEISTAAALCRRGFDIDLNLKLGPLPEEEESESPAGEGGLSACSAVGETVESNSPTVSAGVLTAEKCLEDELEGVEGIHVDLFGNEVSEITNLQAGSLESDNNGGPGEESENKAEDRQEHHEEPEIHVDDEVKSKECRSEGFLGLLIDAAKLISGEFEEDEDEEPVPERPSQEEIENELSTRATSETETETKEKTKGRRSRSKRKHVEMMADLYGDFEDISPVVRSTRGRSQVLPYRYRDSVIEPWSRLSKHRSTTVSTKRRSR